MMNIDVKLTKELIKATNDLRKKYKALKNGREAYETQIEETLKPITKPLNELVKKSNFIQSEALEQNIYESPIKKIKHNFHDEFITPPNTSINSLITTTTDTTQKNHKETPKTSNHRLRYRDFAKQLLMQEEFQDLPNIYLDLLVNNSNSFDNVYGIHLKEGKFYLGNAEFNIQGNDLQVKNKNYVGTNGLYELIFKKIPDKAIYDEEDLKNYKTMLYDTNAHRVSYDSKKQIRGNRGYKYKHIISKLFGNNTSKSRYLSPSAKGSGLMQFSKMKKDYIYWDDPNELVDRMRLLIASHQSGHNNHSNEIVSIIEELKEANIIE